MIVPFAVPHLCVNYPLNCRSIADTTCINVLIATLDYCTCGNTPVMNCLSAPVNGCIISLPHIIVMTSYILISTRFNKTFIRYPTINILLAMVDNMSVICCTSFIYFWLPSTVSSFTTPITSGVKAAIPGGAYIKADINKESTERRQ